MSPVAPLVRVGAAAAAALLVAGLLAGCGRAGASPAGSEGAADDPAPAATVDVDELLDETGSVLDGVDDLGADASEAASQPDEP